MHNPLKNLPFGDFLFIGVYKSSISIGFCPYKFKNGLSLVQMLLLSKGFIHIDNPLINRAFQEVIILSSVVGLILFPLAFSSLSCQTFLEASRLFCVMDCPVSKAESPIGLCNTYIPSSQIASGLML